MRTLVRIKFGSHLYGTSTPQSDLDFKSVYMPDARSILLQRVRGSISTKRAKSEGEKNFAGEVDEESFSLQRYLSLMSEGQTVATDVLFAPEWSMTEPPSPEWREVVANRHRLITSKSAAFVGYCRQQANKYGIKGSRVAAARKALAILDDAVEGLGTTAKLREIAPFIDHAVASDEHMAIVPIEHASGVMMDHWEVCGRKLSYSASIKNARDIMHALVKDYGARALQAESQNGVDWKALSHAVRVARQAIEMLTTGRVTFPIPDAAHILAIKLGRCAYQDVAAEIEQGLADVEAASAVSTLQAEPDYDWIDDFVTRCHRREVFRT
jgi:predicted nucleotidyltransferase